MLTHMAIRFPLIETAAFGLAIGIALPLIGQAAWQGWTPAAFTVPVLLVVRYEIVSGPRVRRVRPPPGVRCLTASSCSLTALVAHQTNRATVIFPLF
jgi:hypothetical protein